MGPPAGFQPWSVFGEQPWSVFNERQQAAHQFVLAAYPDLMTRQTSITFTPAAGQIIVQVLDAEAALDRSAAPIPLVTAAVAFDTAGRLKHYAASGVLLEDTRNRVLLQEVAAHPEWTDQAKDAWLQSVGGRPTLGASMAIRSDDPIRRFLGQTVSTTTSQFRWRGETTAARSGSMPRRPGAAAATAAPDLPPPPALAVKPVWVVEATADASTHYRLEYEPFGGRLVGVVRR